MVNSKIGYKQLNTDKSDNIILAANYVGVSQTINTATAFELEQLIPNNSRDVVHYHLPNKWLIITSSNNVITHKHRGVELHYYDDVTRRSILLGTIFKNQVDDVKIYNGFNGYYPILMKKRNMLLYTVLHYGNSTDIFDSYVKKEIIIENNSIINSNDIIDVYKVYI